MSNEYRVVLLRSKVDSEKIDLDSIIKDLKTMSNGGFAIFKSSRATLFVYIEIMTTRYDFTEGWAKLPSATFFTRPVLCPPRIVLSCILKNDEYQGSKIIFSEKASLPCATESTPSSISSFSTAPFQRTASVQSTPPSKITDRLESRAASNKLSFRSIRHPKKFVHPAMPLPPLSPRTFPSPPFYYSGYVESMSDGNWRVNFSKFFEEVVVPEEDAYSCYMRWVERADQMRCKLLAFNSSDFGTGSYEELYFDVCDHPDCHEFGNFPCVGCEMPVCKCSELVLDNSWSAKIKRATMIGDAEELERCKLNFELGVKNDPSVLFRDRVQMLKRSNYQTHLAQFTNDQKVERCNAFCQRLFSSPGSSSCTTLAELRRNLWRPLRHSSFFLKKMFNPYTFSETRIEI